MRDIFLVNRSRHLAAPDFFAMVTAIGKGLAQNFCKDWTVPVALHGMQQSSDRSGRLTYGEAIYILDDEAHANLLGFHQMNANGIPEGFVFVDEEPQTLAETCLTLDHEIKEQLVNPLARDASLVKAPYTWGVYAGSMLAVLKEVVDPVEQDWYELDGFRIGNYVRPLWFTEVQNADAGAYDLLGKLQAPLSCSSGGYFQASANLQSWQEMGARLARKHRYSRLARVRNFI